MVGLSLVINCLYFFSLFSLLRIKVHNYPLFICCLLEYGKGYQTQTPWFWQKHKTQFIWVWVSCNPRSLGLAIMPGQKALGLPTMFSARPGRRSDMVAKTKCGSVNVSRPRGTSTKVVRSKCESGLAPDSHLLGLA